MSEKSIQLRTEPRKFRSCRSVAESLNAIGRFRRWRFQGLFGNFCLVEKKLHNQFHVRLSAVGLPTVLDLATGLMWEQSGSFEKMQYEQAKAWCKNQNRVRSCGFSDWRLPTLEEAISLLIVKLNETNGLRIAPVFDKRQDGIYTCDEKGFSRSWGVAFYAHTFGGDFFPFYGEAYVRLVRTLR